jgi:hypothetical protein
MVSATMVSIFFCSLDKKTPTIINLASEAGFLVVKCIHEIGHAGRIAMSRMALQQLVEQGVESQVEEDRAAVRSASGADLCYLKGCRCSEDLVHGKIDGTASSITNDEVV